MDKAIIEYNEVVPTEEPGVIWIDDADGETDLGGTLGFTYDFVVDLEENKEDLMMSAESKIIKMINQSSQEC